MERKQILEMLTVHCAGVASTKENGLVADGIIGKKTLNVMLRVFQLKDTKQLAHFLGQLAHETANFKYGKENLNYSASGLRRIFGKYFDYEESIFFARKPISIANIAYANRMGNGGPLSGDGYRFRGRGAIQITGRDNYTEFSRYINDSDVLTNPDIVEQKYYWDVAIWYFNKRNIWRFTNSMRLSDIKRVTKLINGGYNGLDHRINLTKHFYKLLA